MKGFREYSGMSPVEDVRENRVIDWLKNQLSALKNIFMKLRFGQTITISLSAGKNLREFYLTEAGDWQAVVLGIYAEKWAIWSLCNEIENAKFNLKNDTNTEKKRAVAYGKEIQDSLASGISQMSGGGGTELAPKTIETVKREFNNTKEKGIILGKRVFLDNFAPAADSRFCEYEVVHSGGSDAKISTADLKIRKYDKKKMTEEKKYSLKAYLTGSGETTKGTEKDIFGVLGLAIGIPSMTVKTFHKHADAFQKEFGKDFSEYAKKSLELWTYTQNRIKELKAKGLNRVNGMTMADAVKLEAAQKFGSEIIDYQVYVWQSMLPVALKKKPNETKKAMLQILDLDGDPSVLITSGMEASGQLVTWERSSAELDKIMDCKDLSKIDIEIDAPEKPLTRRWIDSGMDKSIGKKTKKSSNLMVVISMEGIEMYRLTSQLKGTGSCQFNSVAHNRKSSATLDVDINEMLDVKSAKAKKLVTQEVRNPGSTPRMLPSNQRPSLKSMRAAYSKVETYLDDHNIKRVSKKQKMDYADLVARGMDIDVVMNQ